ncbi:unnamed protein product, partial [Chrysoparadoxa australica]
LKVDKLEEALAALRTEYNEVRADVADKLEAAKEEQKKFKAWITTLRGELTLAVTKRDVMEEELSNVLSAWSYEKDKIKTELVSERQHAIRLELMMELLHKQLAQAQKDMVAADEAHRNAVKKSEDYLQHLAYLLRRERTAIHFLCSDVSQLFLFFVQRLATLAGSRSEHNDALALNDGV